MRSWLKQWHLARISKLTQSQAAELQRSAIVFSPHQDDEVLGCGGTILRKKQAGAEVKIVFLCDGSESHSQLMPPHEMATLRQNEAIAAAAKLGIAAEDVLFLRVKDGQLTDSQPLAIEQVAAILCQYRPEEVYVPYYLDPHPDHLGTNTAVMQALQTTDHSAIVWEYPVWFWHHWPWIHLPPDGLKKNGWKEILKANLKLMRDFNHSVYIGDLVEPKREALNQHASQVTRLVPDPEWFTLGDVSDGDFLNCFFQDYEIFYCHGSKT